MRSQSMDGTTIGAVFASTVSAHGDRPFLAVPANAARGYLPSGFEISYGEAGRRVDELAPAACRSIPTIGRQRRPT